MARTKDVMELAKEIKVKGKGPYIEDASVVDVRIGRVSVLALSNDSSVLAASVVGEIHFFHVPSLLNKVRLTNRLPLRYFPFTSVGTRTSRGMSSCP